MPNLIRGSAYSAAIERLLALAAQITPRRGETAIDPDAFGGSLATGLAAMDLLAGVLRSDTTISYAPVGAMDSDLLAAAVAQRLNERGVMPGNVFGLGSGGSALIERYNILATVVGALNRRHAATAYTGENLAKYNEIKNAFAVLSEDAGKASSSGLSNLQEAARLMGVYTEDSHVLRIEVQLAGGSINNTTNMWTYLGLADPVRISGGVVVSYAAFDPVTGAVDQADILTCRTRYTSIRRVQNGTDRRDNQPSQVCPSALN